jgi:antitoxin component YwqK of YwqJK toxin-antitoxin module
MAEARALRERVDYHKDGSVRARGSVLDGELHGYWEWFRTDGTRMRSGHFDRGAKVGEWTTYDTNGNVYKVTTVKPKNAR